MKLISVLKQLLQEKKGDSYESNCAMLYFNFPQIKEIHAAIDKDDLYTEDGPRTFGLEDRLHITLLFGLDPKVPIDDVKTVIDQYEFVPGTIENASLFNNEKYDVLKFDVDSDTVKELTKINEDLKELPYKNEFPNYHPHCTIAYVKSGMGKKYVEEFKGASFNFTPTHVVYSESNGNNKRIKINVKKD